MKGRVFLDRRLCLPEEWRHDAERRTQAKVPADVSLQTEPEQAMLEQATTVQRSGGQLAREPLAVTEGEKELITYD